MSAGTTLREWVRNSGFFSKEDIEEGYCVMSFESAVDMLERYEREKREQDEH